MGYGISALPLAYCLGSGGTVVESDKLVTHGIETVYIRIYREYCVMIPSFTVLRLVIDRGALYLDLTRGPVSLEVFVVVGRVPEAELYVREQFQGFLLARNVFESHPVYLAGITDRNEGFLNSLDAVLLTCDSCDPEAVAAFIGIKLGTYGLPTGVPDFVIILYIKVDTV